VTDEQAAEVLTLLRSMADSLRHIAKSRTMLVADDDGRGNITVRPLHTERDPAKAVELLNRDG
jgi:uncharacterized membrane-anchored protein YhcB (DUF1043 family)